MTAPALALVAGVLLGALNALLVALQFALVASGRSTLERLAGGGDRRAARLLDRGADLDRRLAASQLGITLSSVALGAVAVPAIAEVVDEVAARWVGVVVGFAAVVVVHVVVGELVPKALAITKPEAVLLRLAGFERAYSAVVGPPAAVLGAAAAALARLLGARAPGRSHAAHTAEELARLLAESRRHGVLEQTAHDLLAGALDLGGRDVGSILVPAERVVSVPSTATVAEAESAVVGAGVTRLLVRDVRGAVVGFVHAKDLLTVPGAARHRPVPVGRIRQVLELGPDVPLDVVLVGMRRSRTHVAAVFDAGRRFLGIVTLEDVLGAIVGAP